MSTATSEPRRSIGKVELLAFLAGIVGFVADAVTLFSILSGQLTPSVNGTSFVVLSLVYGWFITAWVLVRRNYCRYHALPKEKRPQRVESYGSFPRDWELDTVLFSSVFPLGIILSPAALILLYRWARSLGSAQPSLQVVPLTVVVSLLSLTFIGGLVSFAIRFLMPLVYDDMQEFLHG